LRTGATMGRQSQGTMAIEQPHRPWYRGLILRGELIKQYQLDPCNSANAEESRIERFEHELRLDELAPITMFVGANNSGKSRLLRGLFGDPRLVDWFRIEPPSQESIGITQLMERIGKEIGKDLDSPGRLELNQQIRRLQRLVPAGWLYRPLLETLAE